MDNLTVEQLNQKASLLKSGLKTLMKDFIDQSGVVPEVRINLVSTDTDCGMHIDYSVNVYLPVA